MFLRSSARHHAARSFSVAKICRSQASVAPVTRSGDAKTPFPIVGARSVAVRTPLYAKPRIDSGKLEVYNISKEKYIQVPGRWLRDNFSAGDSINKDTQQRQINVLKGTIDCNVKQVETVDEGKAFRIIFGDGYETTVSAEVLLGHNGSELEIERAGVVPLTLWDAKIIQAPPTVSYKDVTMTGVGELLRLIRMYGFCFVDDTPVTPEGTQSLLEMIGPIRVTHYGGFYDFTSDLSAKDTAYTSESLEPHTDNTYFTEPAGLQALHLLSHTDGSGGESSLVDGFSAAKKLFEEDTAAYEILSRVPVHAHASGNEGISIQPAQPVPVLSHHPLLQHLTQVRWNNADRAGVSCDLAEMDGWYDAASKFDSLVSNVDNQYWFQLTPGKRRMSGGYINRDDFISKYRMTNMTPEAVRATTVTG